MGLSFQLRALLCSSIIHNHLNAYVYNYSSGRGGGSCELITYHSYAHNMLPLAWRKRGVDLFKYCSLVQMDLRFGN